MRGIVKGGLNDGGSSIKSIQNGTATLTKTPSITQLAVPISSVDITKCVVQITSTDPATQMANQTVRGKLTDSTTLTLNREYGSENVTVSWQVIEFNNVKSLQKGIATISSSSTSTTVSIASVDLSKAALFFTYTTSAGTAFYHMVLRGYFINSTSIGFYKPESTYGRTIEWIVIEFN